MIRSKKVSIEINYENAFVQPTTCVGGINKSYNSLFSLDILSNYTLLIYGAS